jgi:hypothetical protein
MGVGFIIQFGAAGILQGIILKVILTLLSAIIHGNKNALGTPPARKYNSSSTLN